MLGKARRLWGDPTSMLRFLMTCFNAGGSDGQAWIGCSDLPTRRYGSLE